MKRLEDILESVKILNRADLSDIPIVGISTDSRKVEKNFLFIAYKGVVQDGHDYINQAISNGATAVVFEDRDKIVDSNDVVFIQLKDVQQCVGKIASSYYDEPTKNLKVIGVTGTNGKTTVSSLLYNLYEKLGYKVGLISTIENKYNDVLIPAKLTTPDPVSLQMLFKEMLDANVTHVCMEVSSHALHQGRVNGVDFDLAVFTNISRDHLDYHGTFSEYIKAKKLLFDNLSVSSIALTNIDDPNGKTVVQNCPARIFEYALKRPVEFKGKIIANSVTGLQLEINKKEIFLRLVGEFNAYNALAVFASATLMGEDETDVLVALSNLSAAEGRLDIMSNSHKGYTAVVDYAHTPDALEKVLKTLKAILGKGERLISVVGCGGNRDKGKRPIMAKLAYKYSDVSIFTSDNPRDENPEDIIDEMIAGLDEDQNDKCLRLTDRREAIKMAADLARKNDIILLAGKGHEKYQEIKGQRFPFDDKEIIRALMRREDM